jgi:predicted enzyme related to lactoylglutathione lyase
MLLGGVDPVRAVPHDDEGAVISYTSTIQSRQWDTGGVAITGIHAILYTRDAGADRAWLADVLGLEAVDAGGGWLIFALPPAELAAHPASSEGGNVELYLMCDNIEMTMRQLRDKGVAFDGRVTDERWGLVTRIVLPSGARLGLYEPRHASPLLPADRPTRSARPNG